jgi:hypothetical protein
MDAATIGPINYSLRFGWVGGISNAVIPVRANARPGMTS